MTKVIGAGRTSLFLAAALALASSGRGLPVIGGPDDPLQRRQKPDDRGRRAEKDAIALGKAQAKRERKAAKRIALTAGRHHRKQS